MADYTETPKMHGKHVADLSEGNVQLRLTCYEDISSIHGIKNEWQALEQTNKEAFTFFQTYSWCIEYHRQYSDDMSNRHCPLPQVFVLWSNDKPIMIWPLMLIKSRTNLKLLVSATEPIGQYTNMLFDPSQFNAELGKRVLEEISSFCKPDCISLNHYPKNGIVDDIIADKGIREHSNLSSALLEKGEHNSWDDYYASLSTSQRKDRRRTHNQLNAAGTLSYKVYSAETNDYKQLVEWALLNKVQWLHETGRKGGILAEPRTKFMLQALEKIKTPKAKTRLHQGALAHCLYLNDTPIAVEVGMLYQSHYYSYLGAIDSNWKAYAPGKVQMEMAQQWAFENNINTFDLLHDPSEYKSSWFTKKHAMISCNIALTGKGQIYAVIWKTQIRPKLKSLYHFSGTKKHNRVNSYLK